jgi:dTDP-4-dehydrorhamnose reductase
MADGKKKILVLGASGMLGSAMLRVLAGDRMLEAYGAVRSPGVIAQFAETPRDRFLVGTDVLDEQGLVSLFGKVRPDIVVNCVGLIKQLESASDPILAIQINALLPHRLLSICRLAGARLVHISTDCVFSGKKGMYRESDPSDACDLYGKSKYLGEIADAEDAITLRTSIIGHELGSHHGLLEWFLHAKGTVMGFTEAYFSGLPTVELARIVCDLVIPKPELHGLYHVSVDRISKLDLLTLVSEIYADNKEIVPDPALKIDRSLNSDRFRAATGYRPPSWRDLVTAMHDFR